MSRISPVQSKMARAAVGWGVRELASNAKMSTDTVSRFERGEPLKDRTVDGLAATLEAAGVEFLPDDGVRLKTKPAVPSRGSDPGGSDKPSRAKPAPRARKPAAEPKAKPAPASKLDQIRALREQGAR